MTNTKRLALAFAASAIAITSAQAGGFSRGNANLDGLYASEYHDQPVIGSAGVTFVSPGRSYSEVNGVLATGAVTGFNPTTGAPNIDAATVSFSQGSTDFAEDFGVYFASVGVRFHDRVNCVGSFSEPYGANSEYEGPIEYFLQSQSIDTYELGATCSVGFDLGRGRAYAIGGVFYESLEYSQARDFRALDDDVTLPILQPGAQALGATDVSRINVTGEALGYRIGAAYEIPEIALRASLIYRSETDYDDISGSFSNTPFAGIFAGRAAAAARAGNSALAVQQRGFAVAAGTSQSSTATAEATLPQQLELSLRSGVAPGTLVFGSIRWTDWSVIERIDLNDQFSGEAFTEFEGFFDDGWTVTLGVGRAFTEDLAGSLAVTWDEGVGTGFDTFTDTYTLAGGLAYDLNEVANIRGGGALVYFTEGEKTQGDFTAESPGEFGFALSAGLNVKF